MRATECGNEARSSNCEPMSKNRIEGAARQANYCRNCIWLNFGGVACRRIDCEGLRDCDFHAASWGEHKLM